MILLTSTSDKLQIITSSTADLCVHASYADLTTSSVTPSRTNTAISSIATTDVIASPAASTQRQVKTLIVRNKHASTSNTVTIQHTDGTTVAQLVKYALAAGESLQFMDGEGFAVFDVNGGIKTVQSITNDSVDNTKLANMAAATFKGSQAGGDPEDMTVAQVLALLGLNAPVSVAAVTLSGTTTNLATGIPSWATEIDVSLDEASTNGTSSHNIQLGTSGGFVTSGYLGSVTHTIDTAATTGNAHSNGFRVVDGNVAASNTKGILRLRLHDSVNNIWIAAGTFARDNGSTYQMAGRIALSGALTQIRWTTVNGTDTADNGTGAVKYKP